jgi:hypothetical protein
MGFDVNNHKDRNFGSGMKNIIVPQFKGWRKKNGKDIMTFLELKNLKDSPEKSLITLSQDTVGDKV